MARVLIVDYFSSTVMRIATVTLRIIEANADTRSVTPPHFIDLGCTESADEFLYSGDAGFNRGCQETLLLSRSLYDEPDRNLFAAHRKLEAENPVVLIVVGEARYVAIGLSEAERTGMVGARRFSA
jgi:hypothetical protein